MFGSRSARLLQWPTKASCKGFCAITPEWARLCQLTAFGVRVHRGLVTEAGRAITTPWWFVRCLWEVAMEAIRRPDIARLIVDQFQNELVWMHVTLLSTAVMRRLEFLRARCRWDLIEVRSAVGFYCFPTARALGHEGSRVKTATRMIVHVCDGDDDNAPQLTHHPLLPCSDS